MRIVWTLDSRRRYTGTIDGRIIARIWPASGAGWEAEYYSNDHAPRTYRFPHLHNGITGKRVDGCKRWVRRQLNADRW